MNPNRRRDRARPFRPQVDGLEARWLLAAGAPHLPPGLVGPVAPGPAAGGGSVPHPGRSGTAGASAGAPGSTPKSNGPIVGHAEAMPVGPAASPGSATLPGGAGPGPHHHQAHHHAHPKRPRRHRHGGGGGGGGGGESGSDLNVDPSADEATPAERAGARAHAGSARVAHPKVGKIQHSPSVTRHPASDRVGHEAKQVHATGHHVATTQPSGSTVAARGLTVRIIRGSTTHPQAHSASAHGTDPNDLSNFDNTAGPRAKRMHQPHSFHLGVSHRMGGGGGGDLDDSDDDRDNRDDAPDGEADADAPKSTVGMDSRQIGVATSGHKAAESKAVPQAIPDSPGDGTAPLASPSGGATPAATAAEGPAPSGPRPDPRGEAAPDESE